MDHRTLIAKNIKRRARSQQFITDFLAHQQLDVVSDCNLCGSHDISIISKIDRYGAPVRAAQCNRCGLVFLVDRLSLQGYGEFYEKVYRPLIAAYQDSVVTPQSMLGEQESYARDILDAFKSIAFTEPGTLIDIGGSTGVVATLFAREIGYKGTVLDPSSAELAVAAEAGCETIHSLFENWEIPDGLQYDLVLCCRTIDHFIDLKGGLLKLRQLIKPEGHLFIDIVDFDAVWEITGEVESAIKLDHCFYLALENAPAILRSVGLNPIYTDISRDKSVRYICRRSEPEPLPGHLAEWCLPRARDMKRSAHAARQAARELPIGHQTLRKRLGRLRRSIVK